MQSLAPITASSYSSRRFYLRFLGVGNAQALTTLGAAAAVLEYAHQPWLLIDCGPGTLERYINCYGELPQAIFLTHVHLDHIGDGEALFYRLALSSPAPALVKLFVPVLLIPWLQRRLADVPNILAEGGYNFWDVFQLIPVSDRFWYHQCLFSVFATRHHDDLSAFGLALAGVFFFSGDTRPIPELVTRLACHREWIFHDCTLMRNPSHTSLDELRREYTPEQCARLQLYHYASLSAATSMRQAGFQVVQPGDCISC
jgi:ribonuclease BN (tRNA processing enzyme)